MQESITILLEFSPYNLALRFLSNRKSTSITKDALDDDINFQVLYFKEIYQSLTVSQKKLIDAKFNLYGKVNTAHLNFGSIHSDTDNHLYTIYRYDFIKVSYHNYYYSKLLDLIYSFLKPGHLEIIKVDKIKGVTIAAFFKHLSTSKIYPRGREESVWDYCNRINKYFNLPIKERIKTDFSTNENRLDSIKLEILPTICDLSLREELEKFFDGIKS